MIAEPFACSQCDSSMQSEDVFCNYCGYPEGGTDSDKNKFHYRIKLKQNIIKDAQKRLRNVKIMVGVIAGLNAIFGLLLLSDAYTFTEGLVSLIASLIFLVCIAWVNRQPLTGVLAAFIFWILLQVSAVILNPSTLFVGILWKVIALAIFIKGITSAKDYMKYKEQLHTFNK